MHVNNQNLGWPVRPPTNTPYFDNLFDSFGIWQHADGRKPLVEHGYALDDAARGLLVCLALHRKQQASTLFDYVSRSLKDHAFYGFFDQQHHPSQYPASEDATGQVLWALGYAVSIGFQKKRALTVVRRIAPTVLQLRSIRGIAYALLGAAYVDFTLARSLQRILTKYFDGLDPAWFWPELTLTYANGIIPYSLLRYGLLYNNGASARLGRQSLQFVEACCTTDRPRGPIGNDGWFSNGDSQPAVYGQQPIDVCYMILAWLCAYELSHRRVDLEKARLWWQWFEGTNIISEQMYDPSNLMAYDGIHAGNTRHHTSSGKNTHSGAESNICFLLSWATIATGHTL